MEACNRCINLLMPALPLCALLFYKLELHENVLLEATGSASRNLVGNKQYTLLLSHITHLAYQKCVLDYD